jgi:ABC-2 type transport system ATP-binding protein
MAVLSDVSFRVSEGSVCVLLGPNGAGKSSLLKILAGLLGSSGGTAEVCGMRAGDPVLKQIIGVVPESLALFDALTIAEHLELTAAVYKVKRVDAGRRIEQLLRVLRLAGDKRTFVHQCSYGMKKKTALAMALLPNPRVLLLDEPFEGMDPITAEALRLQLRASAGRGATVFLTSHILSLVDGVADQVVLLNRGQLLRDSPVAGLTRPLKDIYFDAIEPAPFEDLGWLGSHPA